MDEKVNIKSKIVNGSGNIRPSWKIMDGINSLDTVTWYNLIKIFHIMMSKM